MYSIKSRFMKSLSQNIVRSAISFLTAILIARWLGPEDFGRMSFLIASFVAFKQLLDMASSSAFFTFISQKTRSKKFVTYYWRWIGVQLLFSLFLLLLLPDSIVKTIWKDEGIFMLVLALVATFMQQHVWSVALQMAEAQRETHKVQKLNTLIVFMHFAVVIVLWIGGKLFIPLIFVALIIEWSIASWIASKMYRTDENEINVLKTESDTAASVFKEFWIYCLPFVPYSFLGFAHDFLDRWMLQTWGGNSEQAYYAVAYQFASVVLLITVSILKIFWKEISEAHYNNDIKKVKRLYLKVSRSIYFIGAIISGGLIPWSEEIIALLLGKTYAPGALTLTIMFLYPVHQSMGQIGSTMLYATGNTKTLTVIGSIFMLTSIAAVYIVLAPTTLYGFELASQGLAIKMIVMQLIQVNIMAWYIARIFKWNFDWLYQVVGLGLAVISGGVAKLIVISVISSHPLILISISSFLYILIIMLSIRIFPWIAGLTNSDIVNFDFQGKFLKKYK